MPSLAFESRYSSAYRTFTKRNKQRAWAIDEALRLFVRNPNHPSLHLEKLRSSEVWTIRIDQGNRLFFIWSNSGDTAIFFFVGPHDAYRTLG